MIYYDTILMNDAVDLLSEADQMAVWQWQGMQNQDFLSYHYVCHPKAAHVFCPRTRGAATAFVGPSDRKSPSAHKYWKALSTYIFTADYLQGRKSGKKMFPILFY